MNIIIVTDMEGVAGVVDFPNWASPLGRYYEKGTRMCTEEVNAAVRGFFDAGADKIYVIDGHGPGSIDIELLHNACFYVRGSIADALKISKNNWDINVFAHVGQHAKSGTEYGHLAHTQGTAYLEETINGIPIGEFGEFAFYCSFLGIPPIFGSGDRAFCAEANELAPNMVTVSVKEGLTGGKGTQCNSDTYAARNTGALHISPALARKRIYEGAKKAAFMYQSKPKTFTRPFSDMKPPFEKVIRYRKDQKRKDTVIVAQTVEEIYSKRLIY